MKTSILVSHLAELVLFTLVVGLIYISVQQDYRSGANDPQVQVARDIADHLQEGRAIGGLFPADTIDIGRSLGLFAVLYDHAGQPVRSSASLDGQPVLLAQGVLDFTKEHGEDRVTWQPRAGVRMAMVVESVPGSPVSYVAVGRSLQEVEAREHNLLMMSVTGWLIGVILIMASGLRQLLARTGSKR